MEWNTTSFVAGLKATAVFDPISVSLTYLYGMSPESTLDTNVLGDHVSAEPRFSLLELKGSYALNDSWSLEFVYRDFEVVGIDNTLTDGVDLGSTVYGVGVTYTF